MHWEPDSKKGGDNKVPCSGCGKAGGGMFGLKQRPDGTYRAVIEGRPNRPRRCNVCIKQVQADVERMVGRLMVLQAEVREIVFADNEKGRNIRRAIEVVANGGGVVGDSGARRIVDAEKGAF